MLCQGRIVWAAVADPNGANVKHRPVVIISSNLAIQSDQIIVGVVASNTAASKQPRPVSYIEIPFHPDGRCGTKLKKPTVAVCEWLTEIESTSIAPADMGGLVPPRIVKAILAKVDELASNRRAQEQTPDRHEGRTP